MAWEGTVKWHVWASWCADEPPGELLESFAVVPSPTTGEDLAAQVVWQLEANGESFDESEVVVQIVEPAEFAGRYEVEIEHKCVTRGRELSLTS